MLAALGQNYSLLTAQTLELVCITVDTLKMLELCVQVCRTLYVKHVSRLQLMRNICREGKGEVCMYVYIYLSVHHSTHICVCGNKYTYALFEYKQKVF